MLGTTCSALEVMRLRGKPNCTATCRRFAAQPRLALAAVGLVPGH